MGKIYNQIRGLNPYPGAWTILKNKGEEIELKIYKGNMVLEEHEISPGTVLISKKQLRVATQNGFLDITDLKMSGKKRKNKESGDSNVKKRKRLTLGEKLEIIKLSESGSTPTQISKMKDMHEASVRTILKKKG